MIDIDDIYNDGFNTGFKDGRDAGEQVGYEKGCAHGHRIEYISGMEAVFSILKKELGPECDKIISNIRKHLLEEE